MPIVVDLPRPSPELARCDFCSELHPEFEEEAGAISLALKGQVHGEVVDSGWEGQSPGAWASCHACHELIHTDQRESLAQRGARLLLKHHPELLTGGVTRADLNNGVRRMHAAFWQARTGQYRLVGS